MKTAQELADDADLLAVGLELSGQDSHAADVRRYAAMLRQQAKENERLQADLTTQAEINAAVTQLARKNAVENEALKGNADAHTKLCIKRVAEVTRERDALKADAERLDLLEKTRVAYGFEDIHEGNTWYVEGPFNNVRAAIDAMKGKS